MSIKIKVKEFVPDSCPKICKKGDWIDLKSAIDKKFICARVKIPVQSEKTSLLNLKMYCEKIPLGIAMQLPKGYEAIIAFRSSLPLKKKLICPNGIGIIDNTYNGDNDEWGLLVLPINNTNIQKGERICQFRIQLSQYATIKQKLKWLFNSKIKFIKVDHLNNPNRKGFGSTNGYKK